MTAHRLLAGSPYPLGVSQSSGEDSYNFALFARYAGGVTLNLYHRDDCARPAFSANLDPLVNKSGPVWHCAVPMDAAENAAYYGYQVGGPYDPSNGHTFDSEKILLDPYARGIHFPADFSRDAAMKPGSNAGKAPLGILPKPNQPFDWSGDRRPRHEHDAVVYELHVRGFTRRNNSGVPEHERGTFTGIIRKIPYLKELGVTIVELLPVYQFDPQENNYWGYMPMGFFSLHQLYGTGKDTTAHVDEFRTMVKELHRADIEVILDVVYNHTVEIGEIGPCYSFRGIDNKSYYLLNSDGTHRNDTGTFNVLRTGEKYVRRLVLDSLRYWVEEMHVDGFRFDLCSILTRTADGDIDYEDPPLISDMRADPILGSCRLIAEAWDIASYQVGTAFSGKSWMQWNDRFRDDVRRFVRGDRSTVGPLMTRLYGSDDLFPDSLKHAYHPRQSINFVTAHDGFCLRDLVSYNQKHNRNNGEENADGTNHNYSWNCGWEGIDGAPEDVEDLRRRQIKNFFTLLMLSNGTPMFCAGDEFMNTQQGNNNPYNQDNEITWLNWDLAEQNLDMVRFFRMMIAFRKAHPAICRHTFWREDIRWHGVHEDVDFSDDSHSLTYFLSGESQGDADLYVMINAFDEELKFTIVEGEHHQWRRVVDTSLPSPEDIVEGVGPTVETSSYAVGPRSVVVLIRS